jgi:hypothetical protein
MTQQNRFLEVSDYLAHVPARAAPGSRRVPGAGARPGWSGRQRLTRSMSAADRALVVLLDNGGLDLGLPGLIDSILRELPGSGAIPESVRRDIVTWLQRKLKEVTDNLLESAELALARYEKAKPGQYADVMVLRNSASLADDLKAKLFALGRAGKIIDLYILTHGSVRSIAINDGGRDITDVTIRGWKAEYGKALPLRSVYMMNCEASTLNQAWLDAGAKVVSGSVGLNVLPEPTTYFFWNNWKAGQNFATAITSAYEKTVSLINTAVRTPVSAIPVLGDDLAKGIDVSTSPAIRSSAPVVMGDNTITIASDALTFATSLAATSLATVVVPVSELLAVTGRQGGGPGRVTCRSGLHPRVGAGRGRGPRSAGRERGVGARRDRVGAAEPEPGRCPGLFHLRHRGGRLPQVDTAAAVAGRQPRRGARGDGQVDPGAARRRRGAGGRAATAPPGGSRPLPAATRAAGHERDLSSPVDVRRRGITRRAGIRVLLPAEPGGHRPAR